MGIINYNLTSKCVLSGNIAAFVSAVAIKRSDVNGKHIAKLMYEMCI